MATVILKSWCQTRDFQIKDSIVKLVCLNHDGALLWSIAVDSSDVHTPSIGDIDNDGCLEIAVGTATPMVSLQTLRAG